MTNPFRRLMSSIVAVADAFNGLATAVRAVTTQIETRHDAIEDQEPETIDVTPATNGRSRRKRVGAKR